MCREWTLIIYRYSLERPLSMEDLIVTESMRGKAVVPHMTKVVETME